jgi:hypothetical protein
MGFFDSFTGSAQRRDLDRANQQATAYLQQGWDQGSQEVRQGTTQGLGYLNPYMQQGGQANALYGRFLGLNGADDQRAAMGEYQTSDPFRQSNEDMGNRSLSRRFAAMGMNDSGASRLAMARANLERGSQDYGNHLNRLAGFGQQGFGAAQAGAGIASQSGNLLGEMRMGLGQQQAGNAISYGNARAQTQGMGWQNALNLGGTIARGAAAFAASDIRVKTNIERVGELASGLPVYEFDYVWGGPRQIGVMAQDVMQVFPDAVAEHPEGYLMVDYGAIA